MYLSGKVDVDQFNSFDEYKSIFQCFYYRNAYGCNDFEEVKRFYYYYENQFSKFKENGLTLTEYEPQPGEENSKHILCVPCGFKSDYQPEYRLKDHVETVLHKRNVNMFHSLTNKEQHIPYHQRVYFNTQSPTENKFAHKVFLLRHLDWFKQLSDAKNKIPRVESEYERLKNGDVRCINPEEIFKQDDNAFFQSKEKRRRLLSTKSSVTGLVFRYAMNATDVNLLNYVVCKEEAETENHIREYFIYWESLLNLPEVVKECLFCFYRCHDSKCILKHMSLKHRDSLLICELCGQFRDHVISHESLFQHFVSAHSRFSPNGFETIKQKYYYQNYIKNLNQKLNWIVNRSSILHHLNLI